MNDFETVRKSLVATAEAYGPPEGTYVEAFAALDRIEAEVERLREQREGLLSVEFENRKEIERLRAENAAIREELGRPTLNAKTIAENVRLRKIEMAVRAFVYEGKDVVNPAAFPALRAALAKEEA